MKNLTSEELKTLVFIFEQVIEQSLPEEANHVFTIAQKLEIHNRTMFNSVLEKQDSLPF